MDNHPPDEKREMAAELIKALLEKLDYSIQAQIKIAEVLGRLADTGDKLADMGNDVADIATRYDMVLSELIERYSEKASLGASKTVIPILQEVSEIIKNFKSLGDKLSDR